MTTIFDSIFYYSAFIPHGHCYLWKPELVWLHGLSDGLIGLAYFSITVALAYFMRQRRDLPYSWVFQLFGAFIITCGLTHVMEAWTIWYPTYWVAGGLKAITAIVSLTTAGILIPIIPKALNLPSRSELEAAKVELEQQVRDRTQSLRQSEERYKSLLNSVEGIVWEVDLPGFQFTFVSQKAEDILGYSTEQWLTEPNFWSNHVHPDDRDRAVDLCDQMTRKLKDHEMEYRMVAADGRVVWLWDQVEVLVDNDRPVKLQGIMVDISDRKATEAALAESQQRYQALIENSPDIVERFDLQLRHLYVSPVLTRITGIQAEVFLGKTCRDLGMDEDITNAWEAAAATLLATGEKQTIEFPTPTLQGVRSFEMAIAPEWGDDQTVKSILCISRDITDRKATEQALKTQRDFNQLIAEITSRFINLSPTNLEAEIEHTLQLISEMTQVDTSYLVRFNDDGCTMSMTHEWCQSYCLRQIYQAQNVSLSAFPWATAQIKQRKVVYVPSIDAAPSEAAIDQASCQQFNIAAVLLVPLVARTGVIGLIGFASFSQPIDWDDETIQLLSVLGQTIANAQQQALAEQQLAISEERLRLALSAANQGLYDLNVETGEAIVSPEYALMLGYDPATFEETNARWIERLHPDDFAAVANIYQAYIAGTLPEYKVEFRQRTQSGDYKWILSLGKVLVRDATGKPLRMLGTHTDINDRKQAETQLRDLSDRLELAVQAADMGIWEWDVLNNRLMWDDRTYEMYGIQASDFAGAYAAWEASIHPDDLPTCRAVTQQALDGETDGMLEFRVIHPDQTIHHIESRFLVQQNPEGKPLRMIGVNLDATERKQAEEARLQTEKLRLELNLLEQLLDSVLAGYWDWDIPNGYNYWSPGLKRMFGYEDHELPDVPETWQTLIFAEDLPDTMACFDRHMQSRGAVPFYNEVRYHHRDGSTVWVLCAGQVIEWDADGQPLRMVGCHVDITQLKHAEARLQKSEAHLRQAQRISKLGSWEFDPATEKITWSDQVFRTFGHNPTSGTPTNLAELQQLLHPDDRDLHQQILETAIATLQPYDFECRAYRPDGTLIYIQIKGEPILNATGKAIQFTGTVLDLTERKQAENALRQSEATNRALISAIPDLLIWIHQDGTYLDALGSSTSVKLSKPLPELIGVNIYDVLPFERAQERMHYAHRALQTNEVQVYEYQLEIDGSIRDEEARVVVCGEKQVLCMVRDITSRKQAEAQLLQTTAQLEASNRELEAFAYSVSHDLRSPLRAIDGFSKALLEDYGDRFDDEGKDYFDRIRRNVQRMGMLIDDLLRLSRVSRSEMQYTTVNLSALVQEQIKELQASNPQRSVEFIVAPTAIVAADLTLMRVVITNLLENAWKFTSHHSSARIEFGIIKQSEQIVYFVRDDGAGFDIAFADQLFGVFQRLHNTEEFPGTGIGLATVQRAIHRHGGRVWAEGMVEQGATIYFTISGVPHREQVKL